MRGLQPARPLDGPGVGAPGHRYMGERPGTSSRHAHPRRRPGGSFPDAEGRAVTVLVALAFVLLTAAVATVGIAVHRDLTAIADQLTRSGHQPEFERWLDQLWRDAHQMHDDHAKTNDKRLRDTEAAIAQVRQNQAGLTRYVNWMAPLVQHWARTAPE